MNGNHLMINLQMPRNTSGRFQFGTVELAKINRQCKRYKAFFDREVKHGRGIQPARKKTNGFFIQSTHFPFFVISYLKRTTLTSLSGSPKNFDPMFRKLPGKSLTKT